MTIVAGLDIETTGLEYGDHRLIELYVGLWDLASKSLIEELSKRIHPQRSILADASRIHGIYAHDLVGCPTWDEIAAPALAFIKRADFIVGHNAERFDGPFLDYEFERVGLTKIGLPIADTFMQGQHATHDGSRPNLGNLCFAYGVDYDPERAHAADYDVQVCMACFFKGLDWGFFTLPEPIRLSPATT